MTYQYPLLSQLVKGRKRTPTDRQMFAREIARTAKFMECPTCGETWLTDEGDTCDWCEPTE